jgi:hypothetical protein
MKDGVETGAISRWTRLYNVTHYLQNKSSLTHTPSVYAFSVAQDQTVLYQRVTPVQSYNAKMAALASHSKNLYAFVPMKRFLVIVVNFALRN